MGTQRDIERYLAGQMEEGEQTVFEQRLSDDADLRAAFDEYVKMQGALDVLLEDDVRSFISDLAVVKNPKRMSRLVAGSVAASLLVLAVASIWLWTSAPTDFPGEDQYALYIDDPEIDMGTRSEGMVSKEMVDFRMAYNLMRQDKMEEAIEMLESLKDVRDSNLRIEVNWYLALSYLRVGEDEKAALILERIKEALSEGRRGKLG
ncbi:MAG: hypothetical protein HKN09_03595 [Saprospiraceae bacterium]|nr:hypothetical protein [Saprospiraceae bacterium]